MSRDRGLRLRLRDRARTPTPVPPAARALIAATSHTPGQEAILRLQRTAGNRATAAAVQRRALNPGGVLTGFEFIVGRDVTAGFARAAKSSVRDGVVSPADLSALRTAGLAAQDTGHKGDTIYLPTGLDITNPYQRSVVVHELQHAVDDKAAGGGKVQFQDKARLELAGYRAQGASLMAQLSGASGAARTALARQIGAEWGDMVLLGMLLASRADRAAADPLITLVNTEAPTARHLPPALLTRLQAGSGANLEAAAIRAIQAAYRLPAGEVAPLDGLAGESIADWIGRL